MSLTTAQLIEIARTAAIKKEENAQQTAQAFKSVATAQAQQPIVRSSHGTVFTGNGFVPSIAGMSYNTEQRQAIEHGIRNQSFVLTGAAGTGKTTTAREVIGQAFHSPYTLPISSSTKNLAAGEPGIVIVGFTNKSVNNLKKNLDDVMKRHCMTIHKLLEFQPLRDMNGNICGFGPTYCQSFKLPHISIIIYEEASMIGWETHYRWIQNALPNPNETQEIVIGDINQLPPVFGPALIGFKLISLPIVELKHVYRQALESPIITLAHKIRLGEGIGKLKEPFKDDRGEHGKVTINPWSEKLNEQSATLTLAAFANKLVESGNYVPGRDMIIMPQNVNCGTIEVNRGIAQYLGKQRGAVVWEIIAGRAKHYLAVGDRVYIDKREAVITLIKKNFSYSGRDPQQEHVSLNRWGVREDGKIVQEVRPLTEQETSESVEAFFASQASGEDRVNQSSHRITVEFEDDGTVQEFSKTAEMSETNLLFAYALTCHKSQGSEWYKVFLFLHHSHNRMLTREWMYTAVTRARQELYIICEPDRPGIRNSLTMAALNPDIKGITLEEKSEYFRGKKGARE